MVCSSSSKTSKDQNFKQLLNKPHTWTISVKSYKKNRTSRRKNPVQSTVFHKISSKMYHTKLVELFMLVSKNSAIKVSVVDHVTLSSHCLWHAWCVTSYNYQEKNKCSHYCVYICFQSTTRVIQSRYNSLAHGLAAFAWDVHAPCSRR